MKLCVAPESNKAVVGSLLATTGSSNSAAVLLLSAPACDRHYGNGNWGATAGTAIPLVSFPAMEDLEGQH